MSIIAKIIQEDPRFEEVPSPVRSHAWSVFVCLGPHWVTHCKSLGVKTPIVVDGIDNMITTSRHKVPRILFELFNATTSYVVKEVLRFMIIYFILTFRLNRDPAYARISPNL